MSIVESANEMLDKDFLKIIDYHIESEVHEDGIVDGWQAWKASDRETLKLIIDDDKVKPKPFKIGEGNYIALKSRTHGFELYCHKKALSGLKPKKLVELIKYELSTASNQ